MFPIIRITLEGMRHQLAVAISEHLVEADAYVKAALDAQVTPENIQSMVSAMVSKEIENYLHNKIFCALNSRSGKINALVAPLVAQAVKALEE